MNAGRSRRRPPGFVRLLTAVSALLLATAVAALSFDLPLHRGTVAAFMGLASSGLAVGSILWWSPGLLDTTPRALMWRTTFEFGPPYLGYTVLALHWKSLFAAIDTGWPRIAIACLPMLLVVWAAAAFARYLRGLDELQQRIELQALAGGAALTCAIGAGAGFLHAAGAMRLPGETVVWVFPMLLTAYGILRAALTRRYQ